MVATLTVVGMLFFMLPADVADVSQESETLLPSTSDLNPMIPSALTERMVLMDLELHARSRCCSRGTRMLWTAASVCPGSSTTSWLPWAWATWGMRG